MLHISRLAAGAAVLMLLVLLSSSCRSFKEAGRNLGQGVVEGAEPLADDFGERIVEGLERGLLQSEMDAYLDSLIHDLGDSMDVAIRIWREAALGDTTAARLAELRDTMLTEATRRQLRLLMDDLLGNETQADVRALREELFGDPMLASLVQLRNELTGAETQEQILTIADAFVQQVRDSYVRHLRPEIRSDIDHARTESEGIIDWVRQNAITVILVAGGVLALLIGLVWYFWKNRRHRRMVKIITSEIDNLRKKDPRAYEYLTENIQGQAVRGQVEKPLRKILDDQGILREE